MAKKGLNLIREQLAPPTTWDKVYDWMLGSARILIIIVEIVVMVAFGVRIAIDTEGNRLDKEIEKIQGELSAFKNLEFELREVQTKTDAYRELWTDSSNISTYISFVNSIIENLNGDLVIRAESSELTIRGSLPLSDINNLETQLKQAADESNEGASINFRSVELVELNSRSGNAESIGDFLIRAEIIESEESRTL